MNYVCSIIVIIIGIIFERVGFTQKGWEKANEKHYQYFSTNKTIVLSLQKSATLIATEYYPRLIYQFIGALLRIVESKELRNEMIAPQIELLEKMRKEQKSPEIIQPCLTYGQRIRPRLQPPTPHAPIVSPQRRETSRRIDATFFISRRINHSLVLVHYKWNILVFRCPHRTL